MRSAGGVQAKELLAGRSSLSRVHPVAAALQERPDGARIALVVEGGGMRGAVSGGMALGLDELGLADAFDAAYGSSAGALNAMWLVSGRLRDGIPTWTDPSLVHELIDKRRALRRGPVVDVRTLVEERYEKLSPGLFDAVLSASTELHPIATDVSSGEAVDLHPTIRRCGVAAARAARDGGAAAAGRRPDRAERQRVTSTPACRRRSRSARRWPAGRRTCSCCARARAARWRRRPAALSAALTGGLLKRIDPAMARAFLTRAAREAIDEKFLAAHDADPERRPHILSVRPDPESPVPSRLESDMDVIRAGLEAGRRALHDALGGSTAFAGAAVRRSLCERDASCTVALRGRRRGLTPLARGRRLADVSVARPEGRRAQPLMSSH